MDTGIEAGTDMSASFMIRCLPNLSLGRPVVLKSIQNVFNVHLRKNDALRGSFNNAGFSGAIAFEVLKSLKGIIRRYFIENEDEGPKISLTAQKRLVKAIAALIHHRVQMKQTHPVGNGLLLKTEKDTSCYICG